MFWLTKQRKYLIKVLKVPHNKILKLRILPIALAETASQFASLLPLAI